MRKQRSKWVNWFSFNHYRKRFGASKVVRAIDEVDYQTLKMATIDVGDPVTARGITKNLQSHMKGLRKEFSGQPEINFYHAQLIVLLRRGVDEKKHFLDFARLWERERDFLLSSLNLRWIVAAADTFVDHSEDPFVRALLLNVVTLVNSVKLQESERFMCKAEEAVVDPVRKKTLESELVPLFDGLTGFTVGVDDTLRNMRWRLEKLSALHPFGGLVMEAFERLQHKGGVYMRFKALHVREKTAWWQN